MFVEPPDIAFHAYSTIKYVSTERLNICFKLIKFRTQIYTFRTEGNFEHLWSKKVKNY